MFDGLMEGKIDAISWNESDIVGSNLWYSGFFVGDHLTQGRPNEIGIIHIVLQVFRCQSHDFDPLPFLYLPFKKKKKGKKWLNKYSQSHHRLNVEPHTIDSLTIIFKQIKLLSINENRMRMLSAAYGPLVLRTQKKVEFRKFSLTGQGSETA